MQNGYVRLAVVFIAFSLVGWGGLLAKVGYDLHEARQAYESYGELNREFIENRFKDAWLTPQQLAEHVTESTDEYNAARGLFWFCVYLTFFGFVLPPIIFAAAAWIWRGFNG